MSVREHLVPELVTKTKCTCITKAQCRPVLIFCISPITQVCIVAAMQLRYSFRVYPDTAQRTALAQAFGCARVVFNDAVRP
jgi:putative transposase